MIDFVLDGSLKLAQKLTPLTLYRFLANRFGNRSKYFSYSTYANILNLYARKLKEKKLDVSNKTILEIGGGNQVVTGLGLLLLGAKRVITVDATIKEKEALQFAPDRELILENANLDSIIADKYQGSIDYIFSHHVLEHVADLKSVFRKCKIMLRENGYMYHKVDLSDHTYHGIYSYLKRWGLNVAEYESKYLQYPEKLFYLLNSESKCYMNRKLLPYYLMLLDDAGFRFSVEDLHYFSGNIHNDVLNANFSDKYSSFLKVNIFSLFIEHAYK